MCNSNNSNNNNVNKIKNRYDNKNETATATNVYMSSEKFNAEKFVYNNATLEINPETERNKSNKYMRSSNDNFSKSYQAAADQKVHLNSDLFNKENDVLKDFEDPNAIQFKLSNISSSSSNSKIYAAYNKKPFVNTSIKISSDANTNYLNTFYMNAVAFDKNNCFNSNKIDNKSKSKRDLPAIRSSSYNNKEGKTNSNYSCNEFSNKDIEQQIIKNLNKNINSTRNNLIYTGSNEKLNESNANASFEQPTVDAIVSKLYKANKFGRSNQKFASSTDIKVIDIISNFEYENEKMADNAKDTDNTGKDYKNSFATRIEKSGIKSRRNSINRINENSDADANTSKSNNRKVNFQLEENNLEAKHPDIIRKISQQLKSSTTKRLISINPISTFNVSQANLPGNKGSLIAKNADDKNFSIKNNTNLLGSTSINSIKVLLNPNAASTSYNNNFNNNVNNKNDNQNFDINNIISKKDIAAAPLRKGSKMILKENAGNEVTDELKNNFSKRLSHGNLPKVNLSDVSSGLGNGSKILKNVFN